MPERRAALVSRWASILIFVTVALGSVVCATDSSSACPAWPACYPDQVAPELQSGWLENPVIEFVHRALSFAALLLLAWSGWLGRGRRDPRLRVLPWVALASAVGSAVFGMMIILFTLPLALSVLDLAFALVALLLSTMTARAWAAAPVASPGPATGAGASLAGFLFAWLAGMHLLGSIVAGSTSAGTGSFTRCLSWPLWHVVEIDRLPGLQLLRIGMAAVALVLLGLLIAVCLRSGQRWVALLLGALTLVEQGLSFVISAAGVTAGQTNGIQASFAVAYAVVAVTLLWVVSWAAGRR